jgi:hypothetical protein
LWDRLRDPDLYYAESVKDFLDTRSTLRFPWYKRSPLLTGRVPRAYISIHNVWLTRLPTGADQGCWFTFEDATGISMLYWNPGHPYLGSLTRCDEVFRVSDGDRIRIHNLFFRYSFEHDVANVVEITRYRDGPSSPRASWLQKWLEELIEAGLIPQPVS